MKTLGLLLLLIAVPVTAAWAEQTFPDIQYVSGRAGLDKKVKGTLTLTETELKFAAKEGNIGFTVPLSEIKDVSNSVENNPGSTGAKLALGVFASKKEEFVYVNTETKDAAEAIIFKVKNKTSPGIVAKVKFELKKVAEAAAATPAKSDAAPAVEPTAAPVEPNAPPKEEAATVPAAEPKTNDPAANK